MLGTWVREGEGRRWGMRDREKHSGLVRDREKFHERDARRIVLP
jgi:hypothetical protein